MGSIRPGGLYCAYLRKSRRDVELEAMDAQAAQMQMAQLEAEQQQMQMAAADKGASAIQKLSK